MDASSDSALPEYGDVGSAHVKHTEQLENGKGRAWIWLTVESRAKSAKQRPVFVTADTIRGTVEVDCDLTGQLKEVSVAVTASVTAVGQEEEKILNISQTLWSDKDPAAGKLPAGRSSWPFAIALPAQIARAGNLKASSAPALPLPLPPSFSERGSPAFIEYALAAGVRRGRFKANQTVVCPLVYAAVSRAEPPAPRRRAAYRDGTALVGPDGDPDGWQVSPPANVAGTLFDARQVAVAYTLAVARPLTHARGAPIPLFLTVASDDEQALDLLSAPASLKLCLVRSRVLGPGATDDDAAARSDQVFQESVGAACFWPADAGAGARSRTLWGELLVKADSKPSFVCPGFSLRYAIALLPPQAAGFVPKVQAGRPLVEQRITVTTVGAPGIRVPSIAPPGYEHPEEADYTSTLGYLENGNQRFLHHGVGGTFAIG